MEKPNYYDKSPIAALASPPTESALAIVRTSGNGAVEILSRIFSRPGKLISAAGNTIIRGWITDLSGKKIDEVLVSVYRAPKSYTGEDSADITCHGSIAVAKAVMASLKEAGFRDSLPGEFTFRAFMNGKIDLTRAESVMELVASKTEKSREQAVRRLSGILEKEISAIKTLLVETLAGIEIRLDYPEDEFSDQENGSEPGEIPGKIAAEEAESRLNALAELWIRERIYTEGALAVLAGRPNAGKSSIFNYLLKEDRSIVTNIPGTTRDWIEALVSLEGIPLRLVDTAGLRLRSKNQMDEAERIGIERSFELIAKADVVLYVVDGSAGIVDEDREFIAGLSNGQPLIVIWNKADIAQFLSAGEDAFEPLEVSAKTGKGISALASSAADILGAKPAGDQNAAGPGSQRQKELIDSALAAVREALTLSEQNEHLDIVAPLFRSAIESLGEITGEIFTEDILEVMFSRFCVGK